MKYLFNNSNWLTSVLLAGTLLVPSMVKSQNKEIEKKVNETLSKMTIEEKVGQMMQITMDVFVDQSNPKLTIKTADLKNAIVNKKIGSILNNGQNHAQSMDEWHQIITSIQDVATKESRLKIPILYGVDAIHGATYINDAPLFPCQIGLACTRNPQFAAQMGAAAASATRASGIPWNFSPVLDVCRQPLWSRFPETFGEDTYLVRTFGKEIITSSQGNDLKGNKQVAACMKHFLGYGAAASGKDRTPAYMPESVLREYYLPSFRDAVNAGARTVMVNSGDMNGTPMHINKPILNGVLRGELGFKGLIVTDWEDIIRLYNRHYVASSLKEATYLAIDAGIDMSMVPYNFQFGDDLLALVKEGRITEARIDESVRRILYLKYELGLFENAYPPKVTVDWDLQKKQCEEAAIQSLVLLKNNNNVLPLAKNKKYLVTGPAADYMPSLCGAWSYTWQGNDVSKYPAYAKTIKKGIEDIVGAANVTYAKGCAFGEIDNHDKEPLGNVEQLAASADVIIMVMGENSYAEVPGTIEDINLPAEQKSYMKKVLALGKPVVLIMAEGRPRVFTEIADLCPTILLAPLPGVMGGTAVAKVLFGDANPSGKLAFTYPRNTNMLLTHDLKMSDYTINSDLPFNNPSFVSGYQPLFPFGHGLSYTTFEYSGLSTNQVSYTKNDSIVISVTVKNTGTKEGSIATDVFVRDVVALLAPPYHRLRRINKVNLKAGESKMLTFKIGMSELSYINAMNKETLEAGDFDVHIGNLTSRFTLK